MKNNPERITYKLEASAAQQIGTKDTWMEFGLNSGAMFVLRHAAIDRSSNDLNELSTVRSPLFSNEKIFLRRIITGKASLYLYEQGNLFRLFFQ